MIQKQEILCVVAIHWLNPQNWKINGITFWCMLLKWNTFPWDNSNWRSKWLCRSESPRYPTVWQNPGIAPHSGKCLCRELSPTQLCGAWSPATTPWLRRGRPTIFIPNKLTKEEFTAAPGHKIIICTTTLGRRNDGWIDWCDLNLLLYAPQWGALFPQKWRQHPRKRRPWRRSPRNQPSRSCTWHWSQWGRWRRWWWWMRGCSWAGHGKVPLTQPTQSSPSATSRCSPPASSLPRYSSQQIEKRSLQEDAMQSVTIITPSYKFTSYSKLCLFS